MAEKDHAVGRRRFVAWSIGAALAALSGGVTALLARGASAKEAKPAAAPTVDAPPEISAEARALHGILIARYGKGLDAGQSKGLLEAVENNVQSGTALRAKKLYNGQEPATVFAASPLAPPEAAR